MSKLAGSPAFPIQNAQYTEAYGGHPGMTMRQYYAGLAMQGHIASEADGSAYTAEGAAERSVRFAEALIAELEKTNGR